MTPKNHTLEGGGPGEGEGGSKMTKKFGHDLWMFPIRDSLPQGLYTMTLVVVTT